MALKIRTKQEKYKVEYREKLAADGVKRVGNVLATFWVVPQTMRQFKTILDKHKFYEWDSPDKRSKKERFETYDFLKVTYDRIDNTIVAWEGVTDEEGNELECTRANKVLVFEYNPDVINWVMDQAEEIRKSTELEAERELKNLKSGRRGIVRKE